MSAVLENRRYTATHEWIKPEGEDAFLVGITDHAQCLLGDVVFVELPAAQKTLTAGQEAAVIESVKAAADVYSPLEGEVIAVNEQLATRPELINTAPFEDGWIFKIRAKNPKAYAALLDAANYQAQITA